MGSQVLFLRGFGETCTFPPRPNVCSYVYSILLFITASLINIEHPHRAVSLHAPYSATTSRTLKEKLLISHIFHVRAAYIL